ncbi:hypothetical protein [Rhodoferax sp.]|uniref:hypothetical protein n=1 Tax=Rhodoferax sp. TaxID=50421 RepID=UPI0008C5A628|nr:hypothetical protein [Rhodoferax sp.]MDO8317741.1 hypothetical protein [Rhodoferax sp.]MDP2677356.1 hypothetical protein [Rhodoferax sp.]OGB81333.1 MAG: hypothetical protein A2496_01435 [Burkholderiales bacterium RIFOXYC12_FULL_60_6]
MKIHQLSVAYQPDQDRILVQINTLAGEVLRVWLTRRMTLILLPRLFEATHKLQAEHLQLSTTNDAAQQMLMDFKKQQSIANSDFKTPFNAEAKALPLGPEPLLVNTLQLSPHAKGILQIGFEEKITAQPRSFQISMDLTLLHSFLHLLESSAKTAAWGLTPPASAPMPGDTETDQIGNAEAPHYLN